MIIEVQVTQDDIDHGERSRCQECPVARALRRTFGGIYVSVGPRDMSLGVYVLPTPGDAAEFMNLFDGGFQAGPFGFDLDVPDELLPKETANA
jgi:hypothetical protein